MLKAVAQRPLFVVAGAFTAAGAAAYFSGGDFAVFFSIFLAVGAVVSWMCAVAWELGMRRLAGAVFVVFSVLLFLTGVMAFAPQPILVSYAFLALGASTLAKSGAL
jgi:hypothetical protein